MKIAFLYMDVTNLGDLVIRDTSRFILDSILEDNGLGDCTVVPVDIGERRCFERRLSIPERAVNKFARLAREFVSRESFYVKHPGIARKTILLSWKHSIQGRHFKKHELPKLNGADLIVFGGGGLVKYHKQSFHLVIREVTQFADDNGIPILINSVGVEGYDERHPGCMILKESINRDCVKFVSTRDDYASLVENYLDNPQIKAEEVCDPAFWTAETYGVAKRGGSSGTIGLNVIRHAIFAAYMYEIDKDVLDELYHDLIRDLVADGFAVDLFSNGVPGDTKYINHLMVKYPDIASHERVTISTPQTPGELVELIAGYDRFLAVRLHASIIGTVLGVPNTSLVWNVKQILFGKRVGMPENYLIRDDFDAKTVRERLMNAAPYVMDESYKNTVRASLEREVVHWLGTGKHLEDDAR